MKITRRKQANFHPIRLTQARLAKGLSMVDLARQIDLTRQAISSFEKGESSPSYETLGALSRALNVKESFFCLPFESSEIKKESAVNFRTLKSSSSRDRDQANVFLELFAEIAGNLQDNYVEFPAIRLPRFNIDDFEKLSDDEIDYFAEQTRRFFNIGDGPISNLTLLLENNGVFIGYVPLAIGMEGISAWINGKAVVLINRKSYLCRARLDLAHELGHLVLHSSLAQEDLQKKEILDLVERQAFRFGGAFLVPEKSLAHEAYGITDISALLELKKRWGMSMQALIFRLHAIEFITDRQKTYLFQKLAQLGMRKKEPLDGDCAPERSIAIKRVLEILDANNILMMSDFLDKLPFPEYLLKPLSNLSDDSFLPKIRENNVIQLKRRTV